MNLHRRGFLGAILVACTAPAIVRASSLMPAAPTDWVRAGSGLLTLEPHEVALADVGRMVIHDELSNTQHMYDAFRYMLEAYTKDGRLLAGVPLRPSGSEDPRFSRIATGVARPTGCGLAERWTMRDEAGVRLIEQPAMHMSDLNQTIHVHHTIEQR